MQRKKKFISAVLVVIMLLTVMPLASAEENMYEVGDIIQFGSYPQTEVKDENLIAELNALAPEWDEWISYNYYSGESYKGPMTRGDWMRYTDIRYGGKTYRGIKFTEYRKSYQYGSDSKKYQYENGYYIDTIYWFVFESINWRILDPTTGLVMCETILDSQAYNNTIYYNNDFGQFYGYFNDETYTNYASDYETSSIRKWLNDEFCNTAFTTDEKGKIDISILKNDSFYTCIGFDGYEKLDGNQTEDRIFILSQEELKNVNYGFNKDRNKYDTARRAQSSDYAKSQGLKINSRSGSYYMNSAWMVRGAGESSQYFSMVNMAGVIDVAGVNVNTTSFGIRPALRLKNINDYKHLHKYTLITVSQPTCTEKGYTTYSCECADSYASDYTDALGHDMSTFTTTKEATCTENGEERADCSRCDYFETKTIAVLNHKDSDYDGYCDECKEFIADENCDCLCHGKGFWKFLYNILLAIQKLIKVDLLGKVLRLGRICNCGIAHY